MESDNVSTDDDGQRYPGARSRYHPTELKNRDPNSGKCMSGLILMYCSSHWVQPAIQSGSDSF